MSTVLGIHSAFISRIHDPSACLVVNGKLVFAIEEERLNRYKTSSGLFPELSIKSALDFAEISINDVDLLAIDGTTSPDLKFKTARYMHSLFGDCPPIVAVPHPIAHGSGAFFSSSFSEALVVTIDGVGDNISILVYTDSKSGRRRLLYKEVYPASMGLYYSSFTNFLGFRSIEGEYKVMGMSAYGDETRFDLSSILAFDDSTGKIVYDNPYHDQSCYTSIFEPQVNFQKLSEFLGIPPVYSASPIRSQEHFDLAASVQRTFRTAYISLIDHYVRKSGLSNICLSGGCSLNCLANMELFTSRDYHLYIQPSSSDRGLCLGSAFEVAKNVGDCPQPVQDMFLGNVYPDSRIHSVIINSGLNFEIVSDPYECAASLIVNGKVIGWYQGRSEFGPRALGSRSILGSAMIPGNRDKINLKIKYREAFRPFAPAILFDDLHLVTDFVSHLPYMTSTLPLNQHGRSLIGECSHHDGTARVQTVSSSDSPLYQLLVSLKSKQGIGVCINTSFNLAGEPIVESPADAIRTFVSSGLDHLVIGSYILSK